VKRNILMLAVFGVVLVVAGLFAATNTQATPGSDFINLASTPGLSVTHNDAIFTQGGIGAGTGNFDPFLTYSPGGNANTEQGYNSVKGTPGIPQFDEQYGGSRTHAIQAAAIPAVDIGGTLYRVILLDANDQGSEDFMSIDTFKAFLDNQPNLAQYNNATSSFGTDDGSPASLIFNMDDNCPSGDCVLLMRSQTFTPGSGVSDISVALPDSAFPPQCYYGSQTCGLWFYLFSQMGGYVDDGTDPVSGTQNWNVTAGFEEWRTELVPVVNVTKTAQVSYNQDYTWTVDKKVKVDGTCVDNASVDLFTGESQDTEWCIDVTRSLGAQTDPTVFGTITITNPTGGDVITKDIPATITSITDVISSPDFADIGASLTCDGVPYTGQEIDLAAGETLTCTYSEATPGADNETTGTNTATVLVQDAGAPFVATADFDFAEAAVTKTNASATLTDDLGPVDLPFDDSGSTSYVRSYACDEDEGTTSNTATITPSDDGPPDSDTANLALECYQLSVTKDASTSLTRTWHWTIDKSVDPGLWQLFTGESGTSEYTVSVDKTGYTDSDFAVSGDIYVSNAGNPIAATINSVADQIDGADADSLVCDETLPYDIPAGGTLHCSYSSALPDAAERTNTATATQQLYNYDQDLNATPSGTSDYSGNATVDFSSATITEVYATINVTDTVEGNLGSASDDTTFTPYTDTFTCDGDEGTHNNTATIVETGQTASASVTVECYNISVSKDATTTFTRTYQWQIDKTSDCTDLELAIGEVYDHCTYDVTVDLDSTTPYVDSDWAVSGDITVSNVGNPIPATINSVSDAISGVGTASVDCGVTFPYEIAAGGSLNCTYSSDLPDAGSRTNTATATQQLYNYDQDLVATSAGTSDESGNADVLFSSTPTEEVDECIDVTDTYFGDLGTVCVGDTLPHTFTYTRTFGPFTAEECGEHQFPNTASFETNDTGATGEASWLVTITIECPQGCTLTQGYWKTHSVYGPAGPADPTWDELSAGPDTPFFISGQTWYEVFWTNPKGGNAYYILAHQYMAAVLNQLTGAASTSAVDAALAGAEAYFSANGPTPKPADALRHQLIAWAGTLGDYNEGLIGPGHCDMDGFASAADGG
jgi:hypothetical protein